MTKLICLNTWGYAIDKPLNRFFKAQNADILCLQEMTTSPEEKSFFFDGLQKALTSSGLGYAHMTETHEGNLDGHSIGYGNAILSRSQFHQSTHTFVTSKGPMEQLAATDYNIRAFQHVVIDTPEYNRLNILNYHGFHIKEHKNGTLETAAHCQQIADYIAKLDGSVILCGDFNLAPTSDSLRPLNDRMENLIIKHDIRTTRNQFSRSMTPVDYIWVSHGLDYSDFRVLPDLVSDHQALQLIF